MHSLAHHWGLLSISVSPLGLSPLRQHSIVVKGKRKGPDCLAWELGTLLPTLWTPDTSFIKWGDDSTLVLQLWRLDDICQVLE